jgi:hypothetical protein
MFNILTKWGAAIILIVIAGTVLLSMMKSIGGTSTWFNDNYVPRRIMVIENYPVRIILLGEFDDKNETMKTNNLIHLINAVNDINHSDGEFKWDLSIDFGHDLNTKQIRSSNKGVNIYPNSKKTDRYLGYDKNNGRN